MFRSISNIIGVILLLQFSGCSWSGEADIPEQFLDLENVIRITVDEQSTGSIELIEEVRFIGREEPTVGEPAKFDVDEEGRVLIADDTQNTIHLFHPDGT